MINLFGVLSSKAKNTIFIGIPKLFTQQVSPTAEGIFAVEPASTVEVLIDVFMISIFWSICRYYLLYKWNLPKPLFWIITFVGCMATTIGWRTIIHFAVYRGQAFGLQAVANYSFFAVLVVLLFGSIILELIHHSLNNLFVFFLGSTLYTKSDILTYVFIGFALLGAVTIFRIILGVAAKNRAKAVTFG
jgi:hypothetical protein